MNHTAADVIAASRIQVYERHPYLSAALFAMRPHPAPGLGTLAVDEGWRLYYDPETVLAWHAEMVEDRFNKIGGDESGHDGVASVVFHELGHVLRQHHQRRGDRDPKSWNCAGDREINDDVAEAGWKLPGQPLMPQDIGKSNGLVAEEYYTTVPGRFVCTSSRAWTPGSGHDCGGAAGNPTEWEKANSGAEAGRSGFAPGEGCPAGHPSPLPAHEQEVVLRQTAAAVARHVRTHGRGTVPTGMIAWAEAKLEPPKIDWRKRLAALTRGALAAVAGASDFTWRRSGRRSLHSAGRAGWPLAPALHQSVPEVGLVLDTSGSMQCSSTDGERTVEDEALSEVLGCARATGAAVWAVACDAAAGDMVRVQGRKDLQRLNWGGGGTDMRPGYLALRKKKKLDLIVIVTDGLVGGGWPNEEECRGTRLLAVIVGGSGSRPPGHIPFVETT